MQFKYAYAIVRTQEHTFRMENCATMWKQGARKNMAEEGQGWRAVSKRERERHRIGFAPVD